MTRANLIASLAASGLYGGFWNLDDDLFDPVSVAFVIEAWPLWVESLPIELRGQRDIGGGKMAWFPKWLPECFDCDDLETQFGAFLELCLAVDAAKTGKSRGGLAGGGFSFFRNADPARAHRRTWFVDYDGIAHGFDAGNGALDTETEPEKQTVFSGANK